MAKSDQQVLNLMEKCDKLKIVACFLRSGCVVGFERAILRWQSA